MEVVVYAGAIWRECVTSEVERFPVSSHEEAVERLTAWLDWLPLEQAHEAAELALAGETVHVGWAYGDTIAANPPEHAEQIGRSRYGHAVYVVPGELPSDVYPDILGDVWEPFYVEAWIAD